MAQVFYITLAMVPVGPSSVVKGYTTWALPPGVSRGIGLGASTALWSFPAKVTAPTVTCERTAGSSTLYAVSVNEGRAARS